MPMSTSASHTVTVSIVSHGQLALVLPLLAQLDQHCAHCIDKVILTINVAEPDLLVGRNWRFPVERIDNTTPLGFGANHNQAFKRGASTWFLVLNPDIRLDSDVLTPLTMQATADCGLQTPRIFEPDQTRPEQHRAIITPVEILTRRRSTYVQPGEPAWIPGLFMMFRSRAYAQIQGFDAERFFMYGEDFDICARLALSGWRIQVDEHAMALHDARRASHRSLQHLYWHVSSLLKIWTSPIFWRYLRFQRRKDHTPA